MTPPAQASPTKAKRTGLALFAFSCLMTAGAATLPFLPLPLSTGLKAGLVTGLLVAGELSFAASLPLLGQQYINKLKQYVSFATIPSARFFVVAGVSVWLLATLAIRGLGQHLFVPGDTTRTIFAFAAVVVAMALLMPALFRWKQLSAGEQVVAGTLFALPGLLLDAGVLYWFPRVYPNLPPQADSLLTAWLFCGYGVALLMGLVHFRRPQATSQSTDLNQGASKTLVIHLHTDSVVREGTAPK